MSRTETAGAQGAPQARKRKQATQAVDATKAAVKKHARTSTNREGGHARMPVRAAESRPAETSEAASGALGPMAGISPEQWRVMVAEAAYYRAQRRGVGDGSPEQDWFEAEDEIRRSLEER
jgi:hypothetical protein